MDYYDSRYPADYYSVGEQYVFHRNITNRNFRRPTAEEKQYLSAAVQAVSDVTEGKVSGLRYFNKEIGTVVGIHDNILDVLFADGRVFGYITENSEKALFDQTDFPVEQPKLELPKDAVSWKQKKATSSKTTGGITEVGTEKSGGITEAGTKKSGGITEADTKKSGGITEADTKKSGGITEADTKKSSGITEADTKEFSGNTETGAKESSGIMEASTKKSGGITEAGEQKSDGITEIESAE